MALQHGHRSQLSFARLARILECDPTTWKPCNVNFILNRQGIIVHVQNLHTKLTGEPHIGNYRGALTHSHRLPLTPGILAKYSRMPTAKSMVRAFSH